jgi:hypothetical protein
VHIKPLHSPRVTVWCGIIGPYYFEDEEGVAVTVNSERYLRMLQDYFLPQLRMLNEDMDHVCLGECVAQQGRHLSGVIFKQ